MDVVKPLRTLWIVFAVSGLLASCGSAKASAMPVGSQPVAAHFWITNQALGAPAVEIKVSLDGQQIFDQNLAVEDQYNLAVVDEFASAGTHTLMVEVGSPYLISLNKAVDLSSEKWVIVGFWFDPKSPLADEQVPHISVDVFDQQPGIQ